MHELIYLNDDIDSTVERILSDEELERCGLGKRKVLRTLKSFQGDEIATSVFLKKYALRDDDNKVIEFTLDEAKDRWSKTIASAEPMFNNDKREDVFPDTFVNYFRELYEYLLPAGRQMYALGNSSVSNATYTNCISGETLILTDGGLIPVKQLVGNKFKVRIGGDSFEATAWKTGNKQTETIITKEGFELTATADHRLLLSDGSWKEVRDLQAGDCLALSGDSRSYGLEKADDDIRGYAAGLFLGDGTFCGEDFLVANIRLFDGKMYLPVSDIANHYGNKPIVKSGKISYNSKRWADDMAQLGICHGAKNISDKVLSQSSIFIKNMISGLFDADGSVIIQKAPNGINRGIVLTQSDKRMLQVVQNILLSFGIVSTIYRKSEKDVLSSFPKGVFRCKQSWSLRISRESFATFVEKIGFKHPEKREKSMSALKMAPFKDDKKYVRVENVISNSIIPVYDVSLSHEPHAFYANGMIAHNCYVTKIEEDSLEGIYDAARKLARTYSYGGGIGLCIGELRPANAKVSNSARFSTGAVSFMELYSSTTGLIGQHGRRGALMITIPVTHPDIERFIEIKRNQDQVQYANISVKLTDEFMNAVADNKDIELFFKTHHEEYREVVNARSLWKKIIESAHGFAEPGLLFWDRMVEMSPSDTYDRLKVHSTNPCGEQILEPGGACVLSSLLLYKFVKNPFTENAEFDFELFKEMVTRGVRHLDNVVELNINRHGLKEQVEAAKVGRRIGLGVTGLADMYAAMCIRYDSQEALDLADKIMEVKKIAEYTASIYLAKERGSFPIFDAKKHFSRGFCKTLPKEVIELAKKYGLRNVALSTVAPSGSLSVIAQCSGGIEPIYAFSYSRFVELGRGRKEFKIYHQGLSRFFSVKKDDVSADLSDIPEYWVAAHQIDYKYRVRLQGVLQKHIDASISSTINLPEDTPVKVVNDIYMAAWREGLKGVTVYREGSREGVLITEEFAKAAGTPDMNTVIRCVRAEGGDKFYIMVSYKDKDIKNPYQVFVLNYKKTDSDSFIKISNALIKMLASRGVPDKRIQKYIDRSKNSLAKLTRFLSLSMKTNNLDGAVEVLEEHSFAGSLAARLYNILSESLEMRKAMCKKCRSSNVRMEEGCMRCLDCNWSGCN